MTWKTTQSKVAKESAERYGAEEFNIWRRNKTETMATEN
jgi:hypothetical protein